LFSIISGLVLSLFYRLRFWRFTHWHSGMELPRWLQIALQRLPKPNINKKDKKI